MDILDWEPIWKAAKNAITKDDHVELKRVLGNGVSLDLDHLKRLEAQATNKRKKEKDDEDKQKTLKKMIKFIASKMP